jgi:drug/metabolite transporter (DMT)-like permease
MTAKTNPVQSIRQIPQKTILTGILLSVFLNAAGQILFKAARSIQPDAPLVALFLHPETWLGFAVYGLSALVWLWVLTKAQLSYAYPLLALTFPLVVALSAFFFAESVSVLRWVGVGVIVLGVSLLART